MIKYILLIAMPLLVSVCTADTKAHYKLHLSQLQRDIAQCPDRHPPNVSCEQLQQYAEHANDLADELHNNPQVFGQKILSLQESQAKQPTDQNTIQLAERLAVVKWLESPKG